MITIQSNTIYSMKLLSPVKDEEHICRLSQWMDQLREKRESVRGTALEEVLEKWCQLNQLLKESLSTKHGLILTQNNDSIERETILTEVTIIFEALTCPSHLIHMRVQLIFHLK